MNALILDSAIGTGQLLFAEFTLAHITASLNALATVLLVAAFVAIKQKKELLHKNLMLTAFATSAAFLVVYLTRYALEGNKPFPQPDYPTAAIFYYILLITHVALAISVPVLAIIAIVHGLKDRRAEHRKIVKFAFPIWLYVSVTGVIVYFMLYWIYIPKALETGS